MVATWEEDLVDDQQGVADGRGNFILLTYDDNGTNKYICAVSTCTCITLKSYATDRLLVDKLNRKKIWKN